ncbi:MAG: DVUA0089 family protein [Polyangiaceae bacterium]|nr:DVUA0089 family protein [Polyangiaceae bacterium]
MRLSKHLIVLALGLAGCSPDVDTTFGAGGSGAQGGGSGEGGQGGLGGEGQGGDGGQGGDAGACGDGVVAGDEVCDDGNAVDCDGCRGDCSAVEAGCGDGFTCGGEGCDDGNTVDGDGCDADCTPTGCGNGVLTAGEACDDGNTVDGDGCDSNCTPTGCGNGVASAGEQCDDGNADNGDACLDTCVPAACGDGFLQVGVEGCDDGNQDEGDCCSAACVASPVCVIEQGANDTCGSPNGPYAPDPETVVLASIQPAGDVDFFMFTLPAAADVRLETFSGVGPGACADGIDTVIELRASDCTTVIAGDDDGGIQNCSLLDPTSNTALQALPAGDYLVRVNEYANDGIIDAYTLVITRLSLCGDGAVEGSEECDDGNTANGDSCSAACKIELICGDGVLHSAEQCDDGDALPGDGCSAACQVEAGYQCTTAPLPSACALAESSCGDGIDNDGDLAIDLADTDCELAGAVAPCGPGASLHVYNSANVPRSISDLAMTTSGIVGTQAGTIQRVAARLSLTHTYDADLDISLVSPEGTAVSLSSDNGGGGDDYTATIFDDLCAAPVTGGAPPFTGCFSPEQPLGVLGGQSAAGAWTLRVFDDANTDVGELVSWSLAACVAP